MEHVAGPVDDRLEQLIPRSGGRREAGDLVQEAQLLELVVGGFGGVAPGRRRRRCERSAADADRDAGHGHHDTSLRKGCGQRRLRSGGGSGAERSRRACARVRRPRSAPDVAGGRRRAARDRDGRRARPAGGRGPAARRPARPGHRGAGRARSCSRPSSGSGRRTIALRRDDDPLERARLDEELRALDLGAAEAVISAFALYFGLVNLAEARGRVRALRRRERAARDGILDDSVADAVAGLRRLGRTDARARRAGRSAGRRRPS